jgi:cell division protein ZapA
MSILDIRINNRSYQIACDDGQESHVRGLARDIDVRVRELASAMGGQVADGTLLVLTALMLSDELNEATALNKNLKLQIGNSSQSFEMAKQTEIETSLAQAISDIAEDVQRMSQTIADKAIAKA